jgi:hypothetical protein
VQDERDGRIYGLRQTRTALIGFRSHEEAYSVSRALDHHKAQHGCFPPHDLEENPRALEKIKAAPLDFKGPKNLHVRRWTTAGELLDLCRRNGLDFMLCHKVELRPFLAFDGEFFEVPPPDLGELVHILNGKVR